MFHVKQIISKAKQQKIDILLFYLFLFTIPLQLRLILNSDQAYIGYSFSYHKAIFFYLSDLLFIAFFSAFVLFSKQPKRAIWPIILPVLWAFLALFHVERWDQGVYGAVKVFEFWAIISYIRLNPEVLKPGVWVLVVSGLIQSAIGIVQFHVQHGLNLFFLGEYVPSVLDQGSGTISISGQKTLRAYGTMPHPNVFGGFIAFILAIFYYVSRETYTIRQWLMVSCGTFVLWWGLLVSFSRSGWLAAILITIAFISHSVLRKAYKQAIIWAIIVLVSCGTLAIVYMDLVFPRSTDIGVSSQASQYRADFNKYGWEIFKQNNLIGTGVTQYIPSLEQTVTLEPWQYQPPHNIVLLYIAELGIIGFLVSIFTYYKLGFTWNNQNLLTIMLFFGIIVIGALDHYLLSIQQGFLTFAVVAGIILANKKHVSQM
jgi:hypothetical protein